MATAAKVCVVMLFVSACSSAGPPDVALGGAPLTPAPSEAPVAAPADLPAPVSPTAEAVAWRHLATVEGRLTDDAAAEAVQTQDALATVWRRYGLPGEAPTVDFKRNAVLLLGQPDDACVDQLIGLDVGNGSLRATWLPPPGGCNLPLIFRIHAVQVDRRHVPARFEVAFPEPYHRDAKPVTLTIATVPGEAPPAPAPPTSMTKEDLDEVFAGHAVRRCTREDDPLAEQPGAGITSDDPAPEDESAVTASLDEVRAWLRQHGYRPDVDFVPFVSRSDGVRPGLWVDGGAADEVRRRLDEAFGPGSVHVEENRYDFEAIAKAQRDLRPLMGGEGPGSIVASAGIPGPVSITVVDPTRQSLDRIAAAVDAALVCVGPALSGVAPGDG